ncbi:unnamed protein product [Xylocopa violacea]|uniref:Transmembrane protein n=1 Tax=Xylocopa violacea TaxID=135666 RepID=A0ABP1NB36_XYLVO
MISRKLVHSQLSRESIAEQRNRCQSQYEEAPRFGLMSEAWSLALAFPCVLSHFSSFSFIFFSLILSSRASSRPILFSFVLFALFSPLYLSITYLFSFLPVSVGCAARTTVARGPRALICFVFFLLLFFFLFHALEVSVIYTSVSKSRTSNRRLVDLFAQ